jgi:hypothetical protein
MTYTPLPEGLTIRKSPIDNLGLFSDVNIEKGLNAGITHITDPITKKLYRTPLGGFINHSEEPNAKIVEVQRVRYLYFLRDIAPGEEITVKYTMYNPLEKKRLVMHYNDYLTKDEKKLIVTLRKNSIDPKDIELKVLEGIIDAKS